VDVFAEHGVAFDSPVESSRLPRRSCDRVQAALVPAHAPYDGTAQAWLDLLAAGRDRLSPR
jgi:hypothetical protein